MCPSFRAYYTEKIGAFVISRLAAATAFATLLLTAGLLARPAAIGIQPPASVRRPTRRRPVRRHTAAAATAETMRARRRPRCCAGDRRRRSSTRSPPAR